MSLFIISFEKKTATRHDHQTQSTMIRDLCGNSIVAHRTTTHLTVDLVLETIRLAMRKEKKRIAAFRQAGEFIDEFIDFYNHERIQLKTGVAPPILRHVSTYQRKCVILKSISLERVK